MTPDEIIKMAMRAGVAPMMTNKPVMYPSQEALENFAALVAAIEREACARVVEILIPEQTEEGLIGHTIAKAIRERGGK